MHLGFVLAALVFAASARAETPKPPYPGCRYEIALLDAEARALEVEMACSGEGPHALSTYRFITDAHIRDLRGVEGSVVSKAEDGWVLKGAEGSAKAVYRFDVDEMAGST